ncbi:hypothetical protein F8B43_4096 [Methylorubrum populi]|uniref:Uncharacterized protein n=1 Tax=Methylorubrum populi TaxID=223967 RepID=A0A833J3Q5_9HYPH|nr:hypothetical protein F8B43_4096 [Methylorubrum populi]
MRGYFLRAGFFVVRSVPLKHNGDDLTDIDLWIYERSGTLARRRTIIDIKDKARPQAAERLFFVKGLAELLQVDGAGVATTDNRRALRDLARAHSILWLDGADIQRMKDSPELNFNHRLSDEELDASLREADNKRGSDYFRTMLSDIKSTIGDRFGAAGANACLAFAQNVAKECISSHPRSNGAIAAGRLVYMSAAIAAIALDFYAAEVALRPAAERIEHLVDALRYGDNPEVTKQKLAWAEAAVRDYAPNGSAIARIVKEKIRLDIMSVPAEGLATVVAQSARSDTLFNAAKILEDAAYSKVAPTFDELPTVAKSFVGAVLDFVGVDRSSFATSWSNEDVSVVEKSSSPKPVAEESARPTSSDVSEKGLDQSCETSQNEASSDNDTSEPKDLRLI